MERFLHAFANELVKVASTSFTTAPKPPRPATGIVRPPSTATGNEPTVPKPTNYSPPSGEMLGAIPTQRMESPPKQQPDTWRPSPGYRPNPASDPVTEQPKPQTTRSAPQTPGTGEPAWETMNQRFERRRDEANYNRNLDKEKNAPPRKTPTPAGSVWGNMRTMMGGQAGVAKGQAMQQESDQARAERRMGTSSRR